MIAGLIILSGYFLPFAWLMEIRLVLLGWGVTLLGVAGLIGIINLIGVHWAKMRGGGPFGTDRSSFVLILSFFGTFAAGIWLGPSDPGFQKIVTVGLKSIEVSFVAMLSVVLAYACFRIMQRRKGLMAWAFLVSALFSLIILAGLLDGVRSSSNLAGLIGIMNRLPLGGARGILMGIALGSVATGLRIILGYDKPYRG